MHPTQSKNKDYEHQPYQGLVVIWQNAVLLAMYHVMATLDKALNKNPVIRFSGMRPS